MEKNSKAYHLSLDLKQKQPGFEPSSRGLGSSPRLREDPDPMLLRASCSNCSLMEACSGYYHMLLHLFPCEGFIEAYSSNHCKDG